MIDIHCHILPEVDDGAQSMEDSLAMAKQAVSEGITSIIATPHHKNGQYENIKQDIINKVAELNEVLTAESIPLTIYPGQESRIYGELLEDYQKEEVLSLNNGNKYLFIELPSSSVPRYTERLLYDILMHGLTPIIVHPERNREILTSPEILYEFVKKGALTQVTAASLTGGFGKKIKKFSMQLIEANLTHFISSDAHNVTSRNFKLQEAYDVVEKKYGNELVYLFMDNSELLLEGKTAYKEIPQMISSKKFLGLF